MRLPEGGVELLFISSMVPGENVRPAQHRLRPCDWRLSSNRNGLYTVGT